MDDQSRAALRLLAELQRADENDTRAVPGQAPAVRITIRTAEGEYLGEVVLSTRAAEEAAKATSCAAEYALTKDLTPIDPVLEADFAEYCIGLPVDELVAQARRDPNAAVAAFDAITEEGKL
ncbi:hypothetical protein ACIBI8_37110 [Streptomyces sp. NPDC050529]|uniref:hypothetical protein n=1 Tax=Streptomyces sp. NPDC050529 TaxID=3365624 RepID=UPI0037AE518E